MRYGLYARKSTEEDERQAQSIQTQLSLTEELARREQIDYVLFEESRSAKEPGRPVFDRLMALIDTGEIQGILSLHPDRLSRNEMDGAALTMRIRKGKLLNLKFVNYFFHNSPEGVMMLQFALSQSQYMVTKLSRDVKQGMENKIKKGWSPHRAPPGYGNDKHMDKGEKTISLDPLRAPLIRRAFDALLSGGYLPQEVLHLLNGEWGYRTPLTRKTGGDPMSKTVFYRMLSNRFYTGFFLQKGILYPGKHPTLLSLEEFERLQKVLKRGERVGRKVHVFLYSGMIRCFHCRCLITAQVTRNRYGREYPYYRCTHCRGQVISEAKLQALVEEELQKVSIGPTDFREWAERVIYRSQVQERKTDHLIYEQKLVSLAQVDGRLNTLLSALTKGLIEEEEYRSHKQKLQEERMTLHRETQEVEVRSDRARESLENMLEFITHVQEWMEFGDVAMKRACVSALGSNFLLDGKKLLLEPHPLLVTMRERGKVLEEEYREIKLDEKGSGSVKKDALTSIRTSWSRMWVSNQTLAYEQNLYFPDLRKIL